MRAVHFLPQTFFVVVVVVVVVKGESVYDQKDVDVDVRLTVMVGQLAYWLPLLETID